MPPKKKKDAEEENEDEGIAIPTKIKTKPWSTFDRFLEILAIVTNLTKNPLFADASSSPALIKWHQNLRKAHTASKNFKFPTESGSLKKMDLPNKSQASPNNRIIAQIFLDFINKHISEIEKDLTNEIEEAKQLKNTIKKKHTEHVNKQLEIDNNDFGENNNESDHEHDDDDEECFSTPSLKKSIYETTQEELIEDYELNFEKINEAEKKIEKKRKLEVVSPMYERKFKNIQTMALETKSKMAKIKESPPVRLDIDETFDIMLEGPKKLDVQVSLQAIVKQASILRRKFIENIQKDEDQIDFDFSLSTPILKQVKSLYEQHCKRVDEFSTGLMEEKNQFLARIEEQKTKYLEEWNNRYNEQQTNGSSEDYSKLKTIYETIDRVYTKKKESMEERSKQFDKEDEEILQNMLK